MKNWLKNLLLNWAEKLKCHPECSVDSPCHCHFCGEPNSKDHVCVDSKLMPKKDFKFYNLIKEAIEEYKLCPHCNDTGIIKKTEWTGTDDSYEVDIKCKCQEE